MLLDVLQAGCNIQDQDKAVRLVWAAVACLAFRTTAHDMVIRTYWSRTFAQWLQVSRAALLLIQTRLEGDLLMQGGLQ